MKDILDKFFQPASVAVFGATEKEGKVGCALMHNLAGFGGEVYPVNPKYDTVMGLKCYPSARALPQPSDLALIATPALGVPALVAECGKAGLRQVVVLSAGFKEQGPTGERLQQQLIASAKRAKVRLIGPNCLGLATPSHGLNATFAPAMPQAGRVAFITQSGALGAAVMDWAFEKKVGFSHFVSLGGMADLRFDQMTDYFGADSRTACILIYMESLDHARQFMSAARAFARSKPIVLLKAGVSAEGARAVLTHTGRLAGNDAVFDAAMRRAGVIRVHTIQELFDCAQALALQPLPTGRRLAIISNAGGPAILAADALSRQKGELAQLDSAGFEKIAPLLHPAGSRSNPIDLLGDADESRYRAALKACLSDKNTDAALVILAAQRVTDPAAVARAVAEEAASVLSKPVYASWMGAGSVRGGREALEALRIPWYPFPERAVTAFMHAARYRKNLDLLHETPPDLPIEFADIQCEQAQALLSRVRAEGRLTLRTDEGKTLLGYYGISSNPAILCADVEEALAAAHQTGYPIALKIDSPDIPHKSDVYGVRLGVNSDESLRNTFALLMDTVRQRQPEARIRGLTVERMLEHRHELILGACKDPVFGPAIMFGQGGGATEVWQDHVVGLPPLNLALARRLVERARISRLLEGYRDLPPVDLEKLYVALVRFAYLLMDHPGISEIEINPLAVTDQDFTALDVRVRLEAEAPSLTHPYAHLSIQPYPLQWIKSAVLKDGTEVLLRPIRPEDTPLEARLVKRASKESLYFRFFGYIAGMDEKFLSRFTHIDYDREMAIVAIVEIAGELQIIGVVRVVGDGWRESCEYAILVEDAWHGKGLGSVLTDYILEIARAQGYKRVTASFLKANSAMRRLFQRKGFRIKAGRDEADYAEMKL